MTGQPIQCDAVNMAGDRCGLQAGHSGQHLMAAPTASPPTMPPPAPVVPAIEAQHDVSGAPTAETPGAPQQWGAQHPAPTKSHFGRNFVIGAALVLVAVVAVLGSEGGSGNTRTTPTDRATPAQRTSAPVAVTPNPASKYTLAQQNAIESAQSYLDYAAFSRQGLIEQLKYEGYSAGDATIAVDAVDPDWNAQAARMAQQYLDYSSFSRQSLIEQLEFDGFTHSQAVYGVSQVGL